MGDNIRGNFANEGGFAYIYTLVEKDGGFYFADNILTSLMGFTGLALDDAQESGTGLGLSVIQGVVIHMGGAIEVRSRISERTAFILYLPVLEQVSVDSVQEPESPPSGMERVLFVDDDPHIQSRSMNPILPEPVT